MGHVLQVTLGEDPDGTGIPVYHAVVDYVVHVDDLLASPTSAGIPSSTIQVRKCFETRHLLEEGFANVDLLVLADDPTMSVLLHDFLADIAEKDREPPSGWLSMGVLIVGALLVGTSISGAVHAVVRLDPVQQFSGWISVVVGVMLLVPLSAFIHTTVAKCYRWAGPLSERPGTIIHGTTFESWNECHRLRHCVANVTDPFETFFDKDGIITLNSTMNSQLPHQRSSFLWNPNNTATVTTMAQATNGMPITPSATQVSFWFGNGTATATSVRQQQANGITTTTTYANTDRGEFNIHLPSSGQDSTVSSMSSQSNLQLTPLDRKDSHNKKKRGSNSMFSDEAAISHWSQLDEL